MSPQTFFSQLFQPDNFTPPSVEEETIDFETMIANEVEKYYQLGNRERERENIQKENEKGSFDLLAWWVKNCDVFPNLAVTVRYILCVLATSVNCEWAFSSAIDIVTKKRVKLSNNSVEMLTFLRSNYESIPEYTPIAEIPQKNIHTDEFFEEDQ